MYPDNFQSKRLPEVKMKLKAKISEKQKCNFKQHVKKDTKLT